MQALLEEITASPGFMESLLSGPYVSSLLNCLSQNPDLAAQVMDSDGGSSSLFTEAKVLKAKILVTKLLILE